MLAPPPDALVRLAALHGQAKFGSKDGGLYTGIHDAALRQASEAVVNEAIAEVMMILRANPAGRAAILDVFRRNLGRLDLTDTEDRERASGYFEEIMDAVGLESSDGLLNMWMYGFDPTDL
ncbi:DUF4844 domain-containing protein [Phenylobacterium sp. J367]|uniref:DUF4844 domain-containing protein n=1 Tax=Phenylobacterium sp. J367 TaxID=2898435 RepID=UPI002151D2E1|nr:DUF4844 domain-containing protein [Phenylobacterium sp. J367]MCR5877742.1 DUF4844 domain-containing protein [Phenylobacterium sp. J367]